MPGIARSGMANTNAASFLSTAALTKHTMPITRIIVADAQKLVAQGLKEHFSKLEHLRIVGHARSGKALLTMLKTVEADLVLMDVSMHEMDGIDTTRVLRKKYPDLQVLAHSALTEIEYVNSMLIEGARGYLVKECSPKEMIAAIELVTNGGRYISPAARASIAKGYAHTDKRFDGVYQGLTDREREIIRLIALEKTNDEISAALFLSTDTVKTHRKNLMAKLNVRGTAGLVKYAIDRCWV